jgi:hypothetical protein
VKLTAHLRLLPRFKCGGASPPIHLHNYIFVIRQSGFTFAFVLAMRKGRVGIVAYEKCRKSEWKAV